MLAHKGKNSESLSLSLSLTHSLFFLAKCQQDNLETKPKRTVEPEVPRNFSQYHNLLGGTPTRPPRCYNGIVHWALIHVWLCVCVCVCARARTREHAVGQSCPTLWDPMDCIDCQAPLSMKFPRQEYWSGLSCPPKGIFPIQRSNSRLLYLLHCRQILHHWATSKALSYV